MKKRRVKESKKHTLRKMIAERIGPPETWDEGTVDFILQSHGIDPTQALTRWKQSLDKLIQQKEERGEKVPGSFRKMRAFLDE